MQPSAVTLTGAAASFILTSAAAAAFVEVEFASVDFGAPNATTFRFYAIFDDPADKLLWVSGDANVASLVIATTTQIVNDGGVFDGFKQEDFAQAPVAGAPWDSWVTIGASTFAGNDTDYSPGFLGSDGVHRVIEGSFLSQFDNGGWHDSNPTSPEDGGSVLIAQLTVENEVTGGNAGLAFGGTIGYNPSGSPPASSEAFAVVVPVPGAPGAPLLLVPALRPGTRRRRRR